MSPAPVAVGVDVGGTSVKGVSLGPRGEVLDEARVPTPSPDPTGSRVVRAVATVAGRLGHDRLTPVGVALPGVVDEEAGRTIMSVNVGWAELPMRAALEAGLGSVVTLSQDVRAGAVAEARCGAAAGIPGVVAFVPVGTGVAAAVLVDGRPLVSGGWAGEIGQVLLSHGPFAGLRVEQVASAAATARRAGAPGAKTVAERVAAGDADAASVWQETVAVLAGALAGLVATVAPTTVVIGGGLALAGDMLLAPLRAELRRLTPGLRTPVLVHARHGDRAAALGAALLALEATGPADRDTLRAR